MATRDNSSSLNLSHTGMLRPSDSPVLAEASRLITPMLVDFGCTSWASACPGA